MGLYLSDKVDSTLACWIEAVVHEYAVHATWDGYLCTKYDRSESLKKILLFKSYFCSDEMFLDWIKRGVITNVEKKPGTDAPDIFWSEVEKTVEARKPLLSVPLTDQAEKHLEKYRDPNQRLFYEVLVDSFSDQMVNFSISLWGYKYKIENLSIGKDPFYILTDRLEARIRFISDWSSIDENSRSLSADLKRNKIFLPIKNDLEYQINVLKQPSESSIKSACMAMFPTLEKFLRLLAKDKGWKTKNITLDPLIAKFESAGVLSDDTLQLLRMVAKPYRDAVLHGKDLSIPVSKVVLATMFDIFLRIGSEISSGSFNSQPS
ncbi:hypothetical protein KA005_13120 [bacterium]|nr:hypothetical protein [bacterium]